MVDLGLDEVQEIDATSRADEAHLDLERSAKRAHTDEHTDVGRVGERKRSVHGAVYVRRDELGPSALHGRLGPECGSEEGDRITAHVEHGAAPELVDEAEVALGDESAEPHLHSLDFTDLAVGEDRTKARDERVMDGVHRLGDDETTLCRCGVDAPSFLGIARERLLAKEVLARGDAG